MSALKSAGLSLQLQLSFVVAPPARTAQLLGFQAHAGLLGVMARPQHINPEYQHISCVTLANFTGIEVPHTSSAESLVLVRCVL